MARVVLTKEQLKNIANDTLELYLEKRTTIDLMKDTKIWYRSTIIWSDIYKKLNKKGEITIIAPLLKEKIKAKIIKCLMNKGYHLEVGDIDKTYGSKFETFFVLQNYIGTKILKMYLEKIQSSAE